MIVQMPQVDNEMIRGTKESEQCGGNEKSRVVLLMTCGNWKRRCTFEAAPMKRRREVWCLSEALIVSILKI